LHSVLRGRPREKESDGSQAGMKNERGRGRSEKRGVDRTGKNPVKKKSWEMVGLKNGYEFKPVKN